MDPALPGGASACEEPCHLRLSVLWNEWGRTTFIKMSPDQDDRGLLPRGRFRGERRLFCARRPGVQWPCTEQKGGSQWQRKMASGRCGGSRHRIPGACTAQRNLRPSWRRSASSRSLRGKFRGSLQRSERHRRAGGPEIQRRIPGSGVRSLQGGEMLPTGSSLTEGRAFSRKSGCRYLPITEGTDMTLMPGGTMSSPPGGRRRSWTCFWRKTRMRSASPLR